MKTLNEILTTPTNGIFSNFENPVWVYAFPDTAELDTYFYLNYGYRIANRIIKNYENSSGIVTGQQLQALAKLIYDLNAKRWEHLFGIYEAEYNPIENTSFKEVYREKNDNTRTVDTDTSTSASASTEASGSTSDTVTGSNSRYGFNSSSAVGDTTNSSTNSGSNSNSAETSSSGSGSEDSTVTDDGLRVTEHTKAGNIGVTENVTMLEHEQAYWGKWSFIDLVCKDICDTIALSIY